MDTFTKVSILRFFFLTTQFSGQVKIKTVYDDLIENTFEVGKYESG